MQRYWHFSHRHSGPLLFAILLGGCISNTYEIELTPSGQKVERKLTGRSTGSERNKSGSLPPEELAIIAGEYHVPVPEDANKKQTFIGQFAGRMPGDVGGHGTYVRWESPLGSVTEYTERFRGNDDLTALVADRQKACDEVADLLLGWFTAEMGTSPEFPKLKEFIHVNLRRDLKNLSLYLVLADFTAAENDPIPKEIGFRMAQYLLEHGYFTMNELPQLERIFSDANQRENPQPLFEAIARLVAAKMGIPASAPIPASLAFLSRPEKAKASLDTFLRSTEQYKRLQEHPPRDAHGKANGEQEPGEIIFSPLKQAFLPGLFEGGDRVELSLAAPRAPFITNGKWNTEKARLEWSLHMLGRKSPPHEAPRLAFAIWSEPAATYQEDHFGQVVLDHEPLARYCMWYQGLNERERKEWDEFIGRLKPDDVLLTKLARFRFTGEKPAADDSADPKCLAFPGVQLIEQGLQRK